MEHWDVLAVFININYSFFFYLNSLYVEGCTKRQLILGELITSWWLDCNCDCKTMSRDMRKMITSVIKEYRHCLFQF